MKTSTEIKKGLECCSSPTVLNCKVCNYNADGCGSICIPKLTADALSYIQQLEAQALPVTIGTPIFSVCYNEDSDGFYVKRSTVTEIWYNCNGWFFLEEHHVGPAFKKNDIGKLIYLNEEEAELICEEFTAKLPEPPKEK